MAKTRKNVKKPVSTENPTETKVKSFKTKMKKKKEPLSHNTHTPKLRKKRQKKVIVYDILGDSISEPKNTSIIIYSEEDDSFHEITSQPGTLSEKTSTPLIPRRVLNSPKIHLNYDCLKNSNFTTPMKEQVSNVSNILSNVSNIIKQISDSNSSFSILKSTDTNRPENNDMEIVGKQPYNTCVTPSKNVLSNKSLNQNKVSNAIDHNIEGEINKTYVSKLNVNLSTIDQNVTVNTNNISNIQTDSFLQEFFLKTNPQANTEKSTLEKSLSWDQNVVDYSLELSQMIKIDPSLADFVDAPGSIENKMKFLITRICGLIEENECLKKHVDWLSEKYKQNMDKKEQKSELQNPELPNDILNEYQKLKHQFKTINNQLDETCRQKDNYKKSMLLLKAEKEAFESQLINLNEIEDDKLRMSELLNKQTEISVEISNIRKKNSELKQDIKILKNENSDLRQNLTNANLIISDQRDGLLDQNLELRNLEIVCKNQKLEIEKLESNESESKNENSKSWIEQVLEEEYYTDSDNQTESDIDLSFESISSNPLTENEFEKFHKPPYDYNQSEISDSGSTSNVFYRKNYQIKKFTGNEHFLPTSDPIKVKLKTKKSNIICKYFLKNQCNLHDDCPYFHPYHPEEEFPFNPDILPSSDTLHRPTNNQKTKNPQKSPNYHNYDRKFYSTSRGVERVPTAPKAQNNQHPVSPYLKTYPNSPSKYQPNPLEREYHSYGKNSWNPERNEPCYYYLKGVCRYGSGCYFYHPQPENHKPNSRLHH